MLRNSDFIYSKKHQNRPQHLKIILPRLNQLNLHLHSFLYI